MPKKISPNAPCPCGSGRKYKKCCWDKGFDWCENDSGDIVKAVPLDQETEEILNIQREKFREEFGRDIGPDDNLFSDMPPVEHEEFRLAQIMREAGIKPELVYAFEKTGRLVSEQNQHLLSEADIEE